MKFHIILDDTMNGAMIRDMQMDGIWKATMEEEGNKWKGINRFSS
jgi:hypothetical protein